MSVFSKVMKPFHNHAMGLASRSPLEQINRISSPEFIGSVGLSLIPIGMDIHDWGTDQYDREKSASRNLTLGGAGLAIGLSPFLTKPLANKYARKTLMSESFEKNRVALGKPLTAGGFSSLPQGYKHKAPKFKDEWYTNVFMQQEADNAGNLFYRAGEQRNHSLLFGFKDPFKSFGG